MRCLPALAALLLSFAGAVRAAVIVSGDVTTDAAPCTLTVTQDVTWTVAPNSSGLIQHFAIVFDNWLTTTTNRSGILTSGINLTLTKNGQSIQGGGGLVDERTSSIGIIGTTDGYIDVILTSGFISHGDLVTLKAGVYNFEPNISLNPGIEETFTGNTFLTDDTGNLLSNVVAVPETSSGLLAAAACASLLLRRSRR